MYIREASLEYLQESSTSVISLVSVAAQSLPWLLRIFSSVQQHLHLPFLLKAAHGGNVSSQPFFTIPILTVSGGGNGYTGSTTCVSGYSCVYSNPYYSQCLPGANTPVVSSTATVASSSTNPATTAPGTGTTTAPPSGTTTAAVSGNPFANAQLYANPYYSSEIHSLAIPSLTGTLAAKATAVAKVGTFVWL